MDIFGGYYSAYHTGTEGEIFILRGKFEMGKRKVFSIGNLVFVLEIGKMLGKLVSRYVVSRR